MHIRSGRHRDGLQPQVPETAVGAAVLGPAGFLSLLETQLGLPLPVTRPGEAALTYLECLREASSPSSFFRRSLEIGPVNVARTLLEWREQWYEAGWDATSTTPLAWRFVTASVPLAEKRNPWFMVQPPLVSNPDLIMVHDFAPPEVDTGKNVPNSLKARAYLHRPPTVS